MLLLTNTGSDYSIQPQPQVITIPASQNGSCFCIDVSAISDTDVEGTEQFELYFENLPSEFATVGEIDTVCVNITDGSKLRLYNKQVMKCEIVNRITWGRGCHTITVEL